MADARRLQRLLEGYNLPTALRKRVKDAPKKIRVFRDTDELTSGILSEELKRKLDESKFLVVICSPNSAQSKYVGQEIAYFRSQGREAQIIPFIIDGVPGSDRECFNPELTRDGLELLGIDVQAEQGSTRRMRFHRAFVRLVAKMFDLEYSVLWDRRKRQMVRRAIVSTVTVIVVGCAISYFAVKAQREKPFDASIALRESPISTSLPLSDQATDTLYVHLDENDARALHVPHLDTTLGLKNIPGRYRDRQVRITCRPFGCLPLDTIVALSTDFSLDIRRDPEIFGHIRHYVVDRDFATPVTGAIFDFGCVRAVTDSVGLLDVLIPLEHQQEADYEVAITHQGVQRSVAFKSTLDPILDRTEIQTISLE